MFISHPHQVSGMRVYLYVCVSNLIPVTNPIFYLYPPSFRWCLQLATCNSKFPIMLDISGTYFCWRVSNSGKQAFCYLLQFSCKHGLLFERECVRACGCVCLSTCLVLIGWFAVTCRHTHYQCYSHQEAERAMERNIMEYCWFENVWFHVWNFLISGGAFAGGSWHGKSGRWSQEAGSAREGFRIHDEWLQMRAVVRERERGSWLQLMWAKPSKPHGMNVPNHPATLYL